MPQSPPPRAAPPFRASAPRPPRPRHRRRRSSKSLLKWSARGLATGRPLKIRPSGKTCAGARRPPARIRATPSAGAGHSCPSRALQESLKSSSPAEPPWRPCAQTRSPGLVRRRGAAPEGARRLKPRGRRTLPWRGRALASPSSSLVFCTPFRRGTAAPAETPRRTPPSGRGRAGRVPLKGRLRLKVRRLGWARRAGANRRKGIPTRRSGTPPPSTPLADAATSGRWVRRKFHAPKTCPEPRTTSQTRRRSTHHRAATFAPAARARGPRSAGARARRTRA
mmetsp:Transcript_4689/g.14887  ORF Transcript_4689/g.14887 Transcript_4689/m.14887 type:complete len:280 (+) Transcript_4689:2439-3278(+)